MNYRLMWQKKKVAVYQTGGRPLLLQGRTVPILKIFFAENDDFIILVRENAFLDERYRVFRYNLGCQAMLLLVVTTDYYDNLFSWEYTSFQFTLMENIYFTASIIVDTDVTFIVKIVSGRPLATRHQQQQSANKQTNLHKHLLFVFMERTQSAMLLKYHVLQKYQS